MVSDHLRTITIRAGEIEIETQGDGLPLRLPWSWTSGQRRREIIGAEDQDRQRPMKVEDRSRILKAIATGRVWLDELVSGQIDSTDAIAIRERCSERSIRMTLSLAFLSPGIVRAIIDGRLPRGIGLSRLTDLSSSWAEQEAALGF